MEVSKYEIEEAVNRSLMWRIFKWATMTALVIVILCLAGCPAYNVFSQEMSGRAKLAEAQSSRQVAVLEARARQESAIALAQAEITRARGAAEANHILQNSLGGPAGYLRYLQIQVYHEMATNNRASMVYVPTETGLPITEAARFSPRPTPPAE